MCGGVIFPYREEYREMLEEFYSPAEVEQFEATGEVRSLYWQRGEPVLPVLAGDHDGEDEEQAAPRTPKLVRWGSRDKNAPFPNTGWARLESIEAGKWRHLKPEPVVIPVVYGVEKGRWFGIKKGIAGLMVEKEGEARVYMLTQQADPDFLEHTRHERMPALLSQSEVRFLAGDPGGTLSATQASFSSE